MRELVQIGDFRSNGYDTVTQFGAWRVAYLNNTTDRVSTYSYFERHLESDELFVLVEGHCKLLLSPDGMHDFTAIEMEPLVHYNVLSTTYHAVASQPGCRILIVENADVSRENSAYHTLSQEELAEVQALV